MALDRARGDPRSTGSSREPRLGRVWRTCCVPQRTIRAWFTRAPFLDTARAFVERCRPIWLFDTPLCLPYTPRPERANEASGSRRSHPAVCGSFGGGPSLLRGGVRHQPSAHDGGCGEQIRVGKSSCLPVGRCCGRGRHDDLDLPAGESQCARARWLDSPNPRGRRSNHSAGVWWVCDQHSWGGDVGHIARWTRARGGSRAGAS